MLLHRSRLTKLQSVQTLIEIQEFINFISKQGNFLNLSLFFIIMEEFYDLIKNFFLLTGSIYFLICGLETTLSSFYKYVFWYWNECIKWSNTILDIGDIKPNETDCPAWGSIQNSGVISIWYDPCWGGGGHRKLDDRICPGLRVHKAPGGRAWTHSGGGKGLCRMPASQKPAAPQVQKGLWLAARRPGLREGDCGLRQWPSPTPSGLHPGVDRRPRRVLLCKSKF